MRPAERPEWLAPSEWAGTLDRAGDPVGAEATVWLELMADEWQVLHPRPPGSWTDPDQLATMRAASGAAGDGRN